MRRFVVLALLLGLMALLQTLQVGTDAAFNPLSLATFGFVLLAAYTLGQVAAAVQLPKITGYIVTGLVFGPQVLNIFSSAVESDLRVVNDLAIGLIALSAGAEMHLDGLRRIARSLVSIVVIKGLLILAAVTGATFALAPKIPFLADQPIGLVLSVGMILGVMAIGTSPAATIAVITETGAKGRLADTTLGVAVAKDIVMVVLLALGIALARTFSPDGHGFEAQILGELALELGLSLLAGVVLGLVVIGYMRYVGAEMWLFIVGVIFATTVIAHEFHLEALLVFILAGFVVQNASSFGHEFAHLVERLAVPVYVVFFSVAGAGLDLVGLRSVVFIVLALVAVRLGAIFVGTAIATRVAGEPDAIRQNAWLSFIAQAGVVIGLSIIVENNLPGLGTEIRTLVMGTVAIHLLLGPVLFKLALTRAGEVRGAEPDRPEPAARATPEVAAPVGALPEVLDQPVHDLEVQVNQALQGLATISDAGPLGIATDLQGWPTESRESKEARLADASPRNFGIAVNRFWSEVHRSALDAPRQLTAPMEARRYRNERWDSAMDRWIKRVRRLRRGLRRLSGQDPDLQRTAPVRDLALYHIDNALVEDLEPVLGRIAAQPALTLRAGLDHRRADAETSDPRDRAEETARPPQDAALLRAPALGVLGPVVEARFRQLRRELASVGTAELSAGRRRPSSLHERAQKARARTGEAIEAWHELAGAVVEHERRRDAITRLGDQLQRDTEAFERDFESRFDAAIVQPISRAKTVVEQAAKAVEALQGADSGVIEAGLLDVSESLSIGLRRQALAGLRRAVETRPLNDVLTQFDDRIEDRLEELPEGFRVVDPQNLPDPEDPPRSFPEPADHQFRLIATGAVERTLRPSLTRMGEQCEAALEDARTLVHDVRERLELRLDAAVDAVMEEAREEREERRRATELRKSLHVAGRALNEGLSELDQAMKAVNTAKAAAKEAFQRDFGALIGRLGPQLTTARPLGARLQAERARVELGGVAVLRLFAIRIRRGIQGLLVRFGLREEGDQGRDRERRRAVPLRPAGPEGSDRAVLFHILFDETTLAGKLFDGALILTILASIGVLMLESVQPFRAEHAVSLGVLEWLFTLLFTAEYLARVWAVDRPARYALSFFGVIDLLAVVPTYLSLFVPGGQYLMVIRVLRVARAFRVLKLARYVGEAQVLIDALKESRYKITVFMVYVVSVAVVAGSAMYLIEGPDSGFTSIPRGVYWSIVTMTTVGFGDITPQSPIGQTLAALLMILGYGIIAVPTGIVTAQIASRPGRTASAQICPKCGHEETEPAAAFCLVCGTGLGGR